MNLLGYLITLMNIGSFGGPMGQLNDLSIQVDQVATLANELKALPGFNIEGFRKNGYQQYQNTGKYLSNNLQRYLFQDNGNVAPTDQGVIVNLYFKEMPQAYDFANTIEKFQGEQKPNRAGRYYNGNY